jgi:hypothetical protein
MTGRPFATGVLFLLATGFAWIAGRMSGHRVRQNLHKVIHELEAGHPDHAVCIATVGKLSAENVRLRRRVAVLLQLPDGDQTRLLPAHNLDAELERLLDQEGGGS